MHINNCTSPMHKSTAQHAFTVIARRNDGTFNILVMSVVCVLCYYGCWSPWH